MQRMYNSVETGACLPLLMWSLGGRVAYKSGEPICAQAVRNVLAGISILVC